MASKETIGAVAECFGEFEEFFNGMDNRVFGYADVTPEKLRILHARILLGDKLGSLVIPKNTTLKLGIACADSDMYVTMLYSKGRMAVPATAGVGLSEDVAGCPGCKIPEKDKENYGFGLGFLNRDSQAAAQQKNKVALPPPSLM
jgi:hypothetical protein